MQKIFHHSRKRARRWLKNVFDCHSEICFNNLDVHENDYDAVAHPHLPEPPSSSCTEPKHQKSSIQQHAVSPNPSYPNTSRSCSPSWNSRARSWPAKSFLCSWTASTLRMAIPWLTRTQFTTS